MTSFRDSLRNAIRNAFCTGLNTTDDFWGRLGFSGNPLLNGLQARATLGYRLFCNREPPPPPPPPAIGGQCPVFYNVTGRRTLIGQAGTANEGLTVTFEGTTVVPVLGPLSFPPGLSPPGTVVGGVGGTVIPLIDGNGVDRTFLATTQVGTPINTNNPNWIVQAPQYFLTRVDGLPDDCPSLPPTIPVPPSPNPNFDDDVVYDDDDGNPVTVPVNIIFAVPFIFINGQLNVPFRVSFPIEINVPVDGTLNIETGDINFNFGGGGGGGGGGCKPAPPDDFATPTPPPPAPPGTGAPPVDIPQDDTRLKTIILGAIVTTQPDGGKATIIAQDSNPDLYIPRVANLQFAIQIRNTISWTERVNITSLRQFVPCPWEGGAVDVRITPEPGWTSFVTPVTGRIPDDSSYEF